MIIAKASEILKAIDPIIGVVGKGADVTFCLSPSSIDVSVTDEGHIAMCIMSVDTDMGIRLGSIDHYTVSENKSVTLNIDLLTSALKFFGYDSVDISEADDRVVIQNKNGKRTLRTISRNMSGKARSMSFDVLIPICSADLRRCSKLDDIGDSMCFEVTPGQLSIGASSDLESAHVYVEADVCLECRSFYPSDVVAAIVKRIHLTDDGNVIVGISKNAPMSMDFTVSCAHYAILIAPRIEAD
ncbi:MAG: hypothetical protein RBR71_12605 [Gudongella sp.]|nr:hypothetical protein [Gudongella sp.]